ncbi:TPA: helix-turn-helix transcriptional regulator [Pseudomonas aeruginosa]|uniref:helix-turn-helix domain-containing protein n=1 Tax=Pseudomonas aeruginosa TaxID=287 RepID=UPI001E31F17D|nr:helix-turn-helix transcriptional regulator [Pseudomonas aeruginosa]MCV4047254.1 helix-turn-helix domain-containing protein [Pseudomonas aeruginosa]
MMVTKSLPVNRNGNFFVTIGERLKEERERLAFTQPAFAAVAGTTKKSQIDYEKDVTQPKAGYLADVARLGVDVQYVVTGVRSVAALSSDERELLALFQAAPLAVKAAAIGALREGGGHVSVQTNVHAPGGNAAGRDLTINGKEERTREPKSKRSKG